MLTHKKYFFVINYQAHVLINNKIFVHVRMYTIYSCLSKCGFSIPAKNSYHTFSLSKKVHPCGSGLDSMLSAVDKREICSHVTVLRIKGV